MIILFCYKEKNLNISADSMLEMSQPDLNPITMYSCNQNQFFSRRLVKDSLLEDNYPNPHIKDKDKVISNKKEEQDHQIKINTISKNNIGNVSIYELM